MARKHNLDEVLRSLGKKHDVRVYPNKGDIEVLNGADKTNDLGNKSWGKIDFLCNYCGYSWYKVSKFSDK